MHIVGVGDAIFNRRLSRMTRWPLEPLTEIIRGADAAYVNFEMVTPELPATPGAAPIGFRIGVPPWTIDELQWMGFDLFGAANNHSVDYGVRGLVDTIRQFEHRGVAYAGAGMNLERARMPSFHDTPSGRVALLGVTSSGAGNSLAADGAGVFAARPGTNPLRFSTEYQLSPEAFEKLQSIDVELGTAVATEFMYELGIFPGVESALEGRRHFLGRIFASAERSRVATTPLQRDLDEIARWVDDARRAADVVVVGLHSHESASDGWNMEEAADFIPQAARAFIEAGADVVFGHGPHRLRGVELHEGRPIFYSLGNFLFVDESIDLIDPEEFRLFGMDPRSTPADFHAWRERWPDGEPRGFLSQDAYWHSILARCSFDEHGCTTIELHPLDLGRHRGGTLRGLPQLAEGDIADHTLSEVARMSSSNYGTDIEIRRGPAGSVGYVVVG